MSNFASRARRVMLYTTEEEKAELTEALIRDIVSVGQLYGLGLALNAELLQVDQFCKLVRSVDAVAVHRRPGQAGMIVRSAEMRTSLPPSERRRKLRTSTMRILT